MRSPPLGKSLGTSAPAQKEYNRFPQELEVTSATKVSSCVGCGVALLGERLRCPACHAQHASSLAALEVSRDTSDEDVTAPRPRVRGPRVHVDLDVEDPVQDPPNALAHWALVIELFIGVVLGLILCVKACRS